MREWTTVGFMPAQAWRAAPEDVCKAQFSESFSLGLHFKSARDECYIFYSKHIIFPTLVNVQVKIRPTKADFVNLKLILTQICQSREMHTKIYTPRRWKEAVAPVLWCGRHAMSNLRERTCLSYYCRKVICQKQAVLACCIPLLRS